MENNNKQYNGFQSLLKLTTNFASKPTMAPQSHENAIQLQTIPYFKTPTR